MKIKKYIVRSDFRRRNKLVFRAGTVVYDCNCHDYGLARDDTLYTGIPHISVSPNETGGYPTTTIPLDLLEEQDD